MVKGKIWIVAETKNDEQQKFGETVSVLITDPDDMDKELARFGPYTIPFGGMITHESLVGDFSLLP